VYKPWFLKITIGTLGERRDSKQIESLFGVEASITTAR
jgi:hypothetical protein